MLKCLSIQLQPELDTAFGESDVIERVKALGRYPEVDVVEGDTRFVNLNFFSEEIPLIWEEFNKRLLSEGDFGLWLKKVAIVACEGEQGWDDYILLHHPDPSETVGTL